MAERRLTADNVRQLYDRHAPALVLYARSYVSDMGIAEDVVHGLFMKLLRGADIALESPSAYLYRAVRNAAMNTIRDRTREAPLEGEWFERNECAPAVGLALQAEIAQLPQEQRDVVIMRIWSGMTFEEIAEAAGVPANTAASRYRYALEKLRSRLGSQERTTEEGKR